MEVCGNKWVGFGGLGEEPLEGVAGDGGVGGEVWLEGEFGEDGDELINSTGAGEDAGMAVDEMVADACECFVESRDIEGLAFFFQVIGPQGVECIQVVHGEGREPGIVDVNVGDDEAACGRALVENARVVDRLCHALYINEVAIVSCFPNATGVSAARHVAGDEDVVRGAVGGVGLVVCAVEEEPWGYAGVDEAATVFGGGAGAFIVGAADVDCVLEGAVFYGELGDEA